MSIFGKRTVTCASTVSRVWKEVEHITVEYKVIGQDMKVVSWISTLICNLNEMSRPFSPIGLRLIEGESTIIYPWHQVEKAKMTTHREIIEVAEQP